MGDEWRASTESLVGDAWALSSEAVYWISCREGRVEVQVFSTQQQMQTSSFSCEQSVPLDHRADKSNTRSHDETKSSAGKMLVRHGRRPRRKAAAEMKPPTPSTPQTSSLSSSHGNPQQLKPPGNEAQSALDLGQTTAQGSASRRPNASQEHFWHRSLPPSSTSNLLAGCSTAPKREVQDIELSSYPLENVNPTEWHPISDDGEDALRELISSKFNDVISSIDGETFGGDEQELVIHEEPVLGLRGGWSVGNRAAVPYGADRVISSPLLSTNYFAKAKLYVNSRLPPNLPQLQLYMPAYPLVCLAAQYSQRAYVKPTGKERETFVNADWRMGTKAMVIKSVPIDDMNCVVFAIRGSQTFMDWAVNLNSAPVAPTDFLDDPGNLCHSGFLSVARKMIKPVAARLRSLLEEDPSRSTSSLLISGHSAGGAVANLLYAHMLAEGAKSELNLLTGCFKRIHCLTFGAPPISLLPITKPPIPRHKRSIFMSFINEGDPVPRADKAYIRSLLSLYTSPAPGTTCPLAKVPAFKRCKNAKKAANPPGNVIAPPSWVWKWNVPPGTLSNAGRLIVLRAPENDSSGAADDVRAEMTCDQQLREVVFGDPLMHMMSLYARRVEVLATKAVTARIWA